MGEVCTNTHYIASTDVCVCVCVGGGVFKLDKNSGCYGNLKFPLTYNGKSYAHSLGDI